MFKFSEFRSCAHDLPEKDGTYLVIRMFNDRLSYASALEYTTNWGWNTSEHAHDNPIDFNSGHPFDEITYWAEVTEE